MDKFLESAAKLMDNIAALVKVKTIVTMAVIWVFVRMTGTGAITADNAMIIISMVISFYFGTQSKKE